MKSLFFSDASFYSRNIQNNEARRFPDRPPDWKDKTPHLSYETELIRFDMEIPG
jgi:hypothetical protein